MCDNFARKNATLHKSFEVDDPSSWPHQMASSDTSTDTSSVESNIPVQNYVEASRETTDNSEPHSSDAGHQGTQLCKNVDENHANPPHKKTPMCLLSELAQYHKLQLTYQLVQESGPAHQKTFEVNVKLGEKEYTASGQSIKKAKHAAAQLALQYSSFNLHSEPKSKMKPPSRSQTNQIITSPTLELKALAVKLNLPLFFTNLSPVPAQLAENQIDLNSNSSSPTGIRSTLQAPEEGGYLKMPFLPTINSPGPPTTVNQNVFCSRLPPALAVTHRVHLTVGKVSVIGEGPTPRAARHAASRLALGELQAHLVSEAGHNSDLKSPISVAHELALRLNQTAEFKILSETGPPRMRNYLAQCKIGEMITQGEGHCKKLAKKKASEAMILEIKKAHPNNEAVSEISPRQRSKSVTPKPQNLAKEESTQKRDQTSLQNPISQLIKLQQSRKEKEPIFTLVSESRNSRSPEFVFKVTVGDFEAVGIGAKKKDAKRAAALEALEAFGIVNEPVQITASSDQEEGNVVPSQLPSYLNFINVKEILPGVLLLEKKKSVTNRSYSTINNYSADSSQAPQKFDMRLTHLARISDYEIVFSDFPKSKTGEFVSIATIDSTPPQICHGLGCTPEEARDHAASNVLKMLAVDELDGQLKENAVRAD